MVGANERMRDATHSATNHSGPDGRSYGDWHAEGDTPQVDTVWLHIRLRRPLRVGRLYSAAPSGAVAGEFHLATCQMKHDTTRRQARYL